jgi:hydrogenase maturation protease
VVGLGQPAAGDDGVGIAIIEALRDDPPAGVELVALRDATPLVELLDGTPLLLVDAVVGLPPGSLHRLSAAALASAALWSTHGMSVPDAIGLAEALAGPSAAARLRVLGIGIDPPAGPSFELSEAVRAAVPRAAEAVRTLCRELSDA